MPPRSLSEEQVKIVCDKYLAGATSTSIAKDFNVDGETVRRWLKISNITMRQSRESLAAYLDENYFSSISDERRAYWFGFLIADACIGKSAGDRRSLRFYTKDEWPVKQFAADIGYSGRIRPPEKSRGQHGIVFNNKVFCRHLIRLGYLDWKIGNPRALENIQDNLIHHFIRGFFDGDGCISFNKKSKKSYYFNFAADKKHYDCLDSVENIISDKLRFRKKGVKIRSTACCIGWNGRHQVESFGKWLYKDATCYLARKYERFCNLWNKSNDPIDFGKFRISSLRIDDYKDFYDKFHYMGCGGRRGYSIGAFDGSKLICAATIGSITRSEIAIKQGFDQSEVRELARFCIHPSYQFKNLATWFLSRVVKHFKYDFPNIKLLVSFADTTQGHDGGIYKASNWKFDGFTGRSYHYIDNHGNMIHKKTIYSKAKNMNMKESKYVAAEGLTKVAHKPKKRFLLYL